MNLERLIDRYCAVWNEPDAGARAHVLAEIWMEEARYTDPRADAVGAAALSEHIGKIIASRPGAKIVRTSRVDSHHGLARFAWRVIERDGTALPEGIDFVEIVDGKIARIVGFFGPLDAR